MSNKLTVCFELIHPDAQVPTYAHGPHEDAGMDLKSVADVILEPFEPLAIPTGLCVEIPSGFEMQIRSRSGLSLNRAVVVLNAPGTIDPGYRDEVKIIMMNFGKKPYEIKKGDRIAQAVVASYAAVEWEGRALASSSRGKGGLGHTGR